MASSHKGCRLWSANVAAAAWHNTVSVLLIPAGAVALFGLVTIGVAAFRRDSPLRPAARGALGAPSLSGAITFGAPTTVLFPVATLWGTFEHAAGPLLVALARRRTCSARTSSWPPVVRWRNWPRTNSWLAPLRVITLTLPLTGLGPSWAPHVRPRPSAEPSPRSPARCPPAGRACVANSGPLISDRPIWLSDATGRSAIALPDEPARVILQLAARLPRAGLVLLEARGRDPAALREPAERPVSPKCPSIPRTHRPRRFSRSRPSASDEARHSPAAAARPARARPDGASSQHRFEQSPAPILGHPWRVGHSGQPPAGPMRTRRRRA